MVVVPRLFAALVLLLLVPASSAAPLPGKDDGEGQVNLGLGQDGMGVPDPEVPQVLGDYPVEGLELYGLAMQFLGADPPVPSAVDPLHTPWGLIGLPFEDGIDLRWQAPLGPEPETYRIYRSVDDAAPELIAELDAATLDETVFADTSAWDAGGDILTYAVTATYPPATGPPESRASNPVLMPGGLGSCRILWAYPLTEEELIDAGYNLNFLECFGDLIGRGG